MGQIVHNIEVFCAPVLSTGASRVWIQASLTAWLLPAGKIGLRRWVGWRMDHRPLVA